MKEQRLEATGKEKRLERFDVKAKAAIVHSTGYKSFFNLKYTGEGYQTLRSSSRVRRNNTSKAFLYIYIYIYISYLCSTDQPVKYNQSSNNQINE